MADISSSNSLMEAFEAAEANLTKLERLWDEIYSMIPSGPEFGEDIEYEDRQRNIGDDPAPRQRLQVVHAELFLSRVHLSPPCCHARRCSPK